MELTYELFRQEIRAFEQRFEQKLEDFKKNIVRWIVGSFTGALLLTLSFIGLYIYILIGATGPGLLK